MCGIIGYISSSNKISPSFFYEAFLRQNHRGPDDEGFIFLNDQEEIENLKSRNSHSDYQESFKDIIYAEDSSLILGHNRLSIIDLTSNGHQPMKYKDIYVTFNGEIYNYIELRNELIELGYTFKTQTDTEVLLIAFYHWGVDCFNKLNGMWAAAFYNSTTQETIISRDRFGIKPLYYYHNEDTFIFASEAKSLLAFFKSSPKANKKVVLDYIKYMRLDDSEETFFQDIYSLPAGYYATFSKSNFEKVKYWNLESSSKKEKFESEKKRLNDLLTNSIDLRLRSDVGIGALLSGGLDSSSIVGLIVKKLKRNIRSFSAIFENSKFSELENIKKTEELLEINIDYIKPTKKSFVEELDDFIYALDFPVKSMSPYAQYSIYKHIYTKTDVKVLLNGQGADEIFGGYNTHKVFYLAYLLQKFKLKSLLEEIRLLSDFSNRSKISIFKDAVKIILRDKLGNRLVKQYPYKIFTNSEDNIVQQSYLNFKNSDLYKNKLLSDLTTTTLPEYLRYEDRNSMRFSVESRLPFLDFRLVSFAFSLPNKFKYDKHKTKKVLRESMKEYLAPEIYEDKRKLGFITPQEEWQKHDLQEYMDSVFKSIENDGLFDFIDSKEVVKIYNDYKQNRFQDFGLIWRLFNLYKWKETFNVD